MEEITFGNFSDEEVKDLFNRETDNKLEFGWQKQLQKTALGEDMLLHTPEKQKYFLGGVSPNIPPNPPTSPVDGIDNYCERTKSPSKLNVNAMPFVPTNVSIIVPSKNSTTSKNSTLAQSKAVSRKLDVDATEPLVNKHTLGASVEDSEKLTQERDAGQDCSQDTVVAVTSDKDGTDGEVQTVGQHTSNCTTSHSEQKQSQPLALEARELSPVMSQSDSRTENHTTGFHSGTHISTPDDSTVVASRQASTKTSNSPPPVPDMINQCSPSSPPSVTGNSTSLTPIDSKDMRPSDKASGCSSIEQDCSLVTTGEDDSRSVSTPDRCTTGSTPHSVTATPPHTTLPSLPPHTSTSSTVTSPSVTSPTTSQSIPSTSNSSSMLMTGTSPQQATPQTASAPSTTPGGVWGNRSKSWASIVGKRPGTGQTPQTSSTISQVESSKVIGGVAVCDGSSTGETVLDVQRRNTQLRDLAEQMSKWRLSQDPVCIQPRGLVNQANWCYMHAPLQALLGCPGFYNLFRSLNSFPTLSRDPSPSPISDTMIQLVNEFKLFPKTGVPPPPAPLPDVKSKKKRPPKQELLHGDPFRPDFLYSMLHKIKSNLSCKGRQEDAEEFLGYILGGLHEEMISARTALTTDTETKETSTEGQGPLSKTSSDPGEGGDPVRGEEEEEEEWEQVGPKNKSTITRQTSFQESPITEIFGGELRSSVHRQKVKESATVQPFFSLQLDIQSEEIWTLKDALEALSVKETVHMSEVEAHKRITLARLPPVLILHLKRFVFDKTGGSQKLMKQVQYSTEMELNKDLLSPAVRNKLTPLQRTYRLWAVVYHHGKTATGGHYTCDVHHPAAGGWVRADDSLVKLVPEDFVLKTSNQSKVAYILFYRRVDTIRT